ncbi:MAG: GlsB/YeaQ/YmgE family stress response membrane protein [Thermoleophilaceae bacterium]|jgi:uncharacterized membrane protein YeaQ/YmgE (transglycosylase-associated protein family)|nr:GlsB/YeaQ/YmgE family stress response membrane protein [Thermoleophilaceae bacterium]
MDLVAYLIVLAVVGLVVGALGRLALPGPDPLSVTQTILVGLAGSFLAGLVTWLLLGRNVGGIALSVLFATGIVYLVRRSRGGGLGRPVPRSRVDR